MSFDLRRTSMGRLALSHDIGAKVAPLAVGDRVRSIYGDEIGTVLAVSGDRVKVEIGQPPNTLLYSRDELRKEYS